MNAKIFSLVIQQSVIRKGYISGKFYRRNEKKKKNYTEDTAASLTM